MSGKTEGDVRDDRVVFKLYPWGMKRPGIFLLCSVLCLAACLGNQAPAPVSHYGVSSGVGSTGVHNVAAGDTLWSISQRYNLSMRDIATANNLRAPFALETGQRLKLPPPRQYRVKRGDTLYSVSRLFGVGSSEIASQNNLRAPYALRPGQALRLPALAREQAPPVAVKQARPPAPVVTSPQRTVETKNPPATPAVPQQQAAPPVTPAAKTKITAQTPKRSSSKFLKPVQGKTISSYGPKKDGLHNDGINIQAPKGTPVYAAENGVVVYAGSELKGSGNLLLIRHEERWMTAYAHLDEILIRRGDTVRRGEPVGTVGTSGSVDTPQLHFEVRRGTEALNPELYMGN
jgi:murein DD-endopeptidase MepM/ murein hydrolase activator NlpD